MNNNTMPEGYSSFYIELLYYILYYILYHELLYCPYSSASLVLSKLPKCFISP